MNNDVIIGTKLVLFVEIAPISRLRMTDYDFSCEFFTYPNKVVRLGKEQLIKESEDRYLALIDTAEFSSGVLKNRIHAKLPDSRFAEGVRDEIVIVDTGIRLTK